MNTSISSPFAAYPSGSAEIVSAETTQENKRLGEAISALILEFYPTATVATMNLGGLLFLCDQLADRLPEVHPLDRARALYTRLTGSADAKAVSDAFTMGSLVSSALRNRTDKNPVVVRDNPSELKRTGDPVVDNYIFGAK